MSRRITDPVELVVAKALDEAGINFVHESERPSDRHKGLLDFLLIPSGVSIECKRFHSNRIAEQMSRAENVIAVQGMAAAVLFADMIRGNAK